MPIKCRYNALRRLLLIAAGLLAQLPPAVAQSKHEALAAMLPDVAGWTADKPTGMDLSTNGFQVVSAARHYSRGKHSVEVSLLQGAEMGQLAGAPMAMLGMSFNASTDNGTFQTRDIDGVRAMIVIDAAPPSVSISAPLVDDGKPIGVLTVTGADMPQDVVLQLVSALHPKTIQTQVAKLPR